MLESLIAKDTTCLFRGRRTRKLVKNGVNITNTKPLLTLINTIISTIINYCAPPSRHWELYYTITIVTIGALVISSTTVTISSTVYLITETYEQC